MHKHFVGLGSTPQLTKAAKACSLRMDYYHETYALSHSKQNLGLTANNLGISKQRVYNQV